MVSTGDPADPSMEATNSVVLAIFLPEFAGTWKEVNL